MKRLFGKIFSYLFAGEIFISVAFLFSVYFSYAQEYKIENGRMLIEIPNNISLPLFQNFLLKYNLEDIGLSELLEKGITDSLQLNGWKVIKGAGNLLKISKPFESSPAINDPEGKFFLSMEGNYDLRFPRVPEGLLGGANNFKSGSGFTISDSIVHFYLPGYLNVKQVFVAGSFNNWQPANLPMMVKEDGWVADVNLKPGKYWYKFIIDGKWISDPSNRLRENDGKGNTNSVFFMTNHKFELPGFANARKVMLSGSFNNWSQWPMLKSENGWQLEAFLAEGTHRYRFVVDGKWMDDPGNPQKYPNEYGEYNSVVEIGAPLTFRLNGYPEAKKVYLAGNFNHWREDELMLKKVDGGWETGYVLGAGNYWYRYIVDGKSVVDSSGMISTGTTGGAAVNQLIIDPNYRFSLKGFSDANKVFLAGDFNQFNPDNFLMKRNGDIWEMTIHLSPGKHIYKFIVDGKWILDPDNPQWEQNSYKTGDSVIWITESSSLK